MTKQLGNGKKTALGLAQESENDELVLIRRSANFIAEHGTDEYIEECQTLWENKASLEKYTRLILKMRNELNI